MDYSDFIPPLSDFGFKNLFGKEGKAKKNLIVLLNAVLHDQLGFEEIIDIELNATEDKAENPNRKTTFYDIYCTSSTGNRIIVEMQNKWESNFLDRMLYYVVEGIMGQDDRENNVSWDYSIVPVIGMALCNFTLPELGNQTLAYFNLREAKTNRLYGKQMGLVFIHLPNFTDEREKCESDLEKIIYSLKNMESIQKMDKVPFSTKEGDFYETIALMSKVSALSPEQRLEYTRWLKQERDRNYRENRIRREGIEEGRMEVARKMLAAGMSPEEVSKFTGLSIDQI